MADQKISQLNELTVAASSDLFAIVDVDQSETKNIKKGNLMGAPGPIGSITPSTGDFSSLHVPSGVTVTDFSNDPLLADDSQTALVTEYAVKTYVDTNFATKEHNDLQGLQGGDATARYHLTLTEHDQLTDGGFTALHQHAAVPIHNDLDGLQGGDATASEFYHLDYQTYSQIDSTPTSIEISNGFQVYGHSAFGANASIDIPGFPTYEDIIEVNEVFGPGITDSGRGVTIQIDTSASSAFAQLVGLNVVAQLSNVTTHGTVKGAEFFGLAPSDTITLTNSYGITSHSGPGGDNASVSNVIAGLFTTRGSFGAVNSYVSKMAGGEFMLFEYGTGEYSIDDAYGILVRTPGSTLTGTITNLYGLYIEDQSTVGFTNDYNIYSAGVNSENYFEGNVGIAGDLTLNGILDSTSLIVTGDIHCNDLYTSGSTIFVGSGQIKSTGGNIELYYSGTKKIETTNTGVDMVGTNNTISFVPDNSVTSSKIVTDQQLYIYGGSNIMFYADGSGAASLYYAGSAVLQTVNHGILIYDNTGNNIHIIGETSPDTIVIRGITQPGLEVKIDSLNGSSSNVTLFHGDPDGAAEVYYAGAVKLATASTGIAITGVASQTVEPTLDAHLTTKLYTDQDQTASENPRGFVNRTDSTISFDDSLQQLSITSSGTTEYYVKGFKYSFTGTKSANIMTTGMNYFYLDESGVLNVTDSPSVDLYKYGYVSAVYWDGNKSIYVGDERHSMQWSWNEVYRHHVIDGTEWEKGLGLSNVVAYPSAEDVHDGLDHTYWTASNIVDTSFEFNSIVRNHTPGGSQSIYYSLVGNGDVCQFRRPEGMLDLSQYSSLSGWIYVTSWGGGDNLQFYGWDVGSDTIVGNSVNLSAYINTGTLNAWQEFIIPLTDMALDGESIDGIRIQAVNNPNGSLDDIELVSAGGDSTSNSDLEFGVGSGTIWDEDLDQQIPDINKGDASYSIFYRMGNGIWTSDDTSSVILKLYPGGRPAYNYFDGTSWTQVEVNDHSYIMSFLYATNALDRKIVAIQAQKDYDNIDEARANIYSDLADLSTGGLPFREFVPISALIYEVDDTFVNAYNAKIIYIDPENSSPWLDLRGSSGGTTLSGGTNISDHGNLSGLLDDDHPQYILVTGSRAFTGVVSGVTPTSPSNLTTKAYVDTQVATNVPHNSTTGLQGGDATASEFYHLDAQTYNQISSDSTSVIFSGDIYCNDLHASGDTIYVGSGQIKSTTGNVELYYAGTKEGETASGAFKATNSLIIKNSDPVDGIVTSSMSDSTSELVTSHVVKTYVDTQINNVVSLETLAGRTSLINGDSTANIVFDTPQPDRNYSVVGNIVNSIDSNPSLFVHLIRNETAIGFDVLFSGPINSNNYEFSWILSRNKLESSSSSSSSSSKSSSSSSKSSSSSSKSSSSSSSSSSKSSSSSSSSTLSLSSSSSSSSTAPIPIKGYLTGFPDTPDYIQVVIGTAWLAPSNLVEDEVVRLYKVNQNFPVGPGTRIWSEDGTLVPNSETNRLFLNWNFGGGNMIITAGAGLTTGGYWSTAWTLFQADAYSTGNPYSFKQFFNTNHAITANTGLMSSSSINFQNDVFKSMDYVTNTLPASLSGFPLPPDHIQVTIGDAWTGSIGFSEDDVIDLYKVPGLSIWTEDGTNVPTPTNRLKIQWSISPSSYYTISVRVPNGTVSFKKVCQFYDGFTNSQYVFKDAWSNNLNDESANTNYFTTTYVYFQQNVFKTFDFISV
jgi:hypothetical protein